MAAIAQPRPAEVPIRISGSEPAGFGSVGWIEFNGEP